MLAITVRLFAYAAELCGRPVVVLELPDGATTRDLMEALLTRFPALAPLRDRLQVAHNLVMVRDPQPLSKGDEVAVFPPVSGGSGAVLPRRELPGPTATTRLYRPSAMRRP